MFTTFQKARYFLASTTLMWLLSIQTIFAQELTNPLEADTLTAFVADLLGAVKWILTPFIVLMIIYVGFQFVTARGSDDKLTKAKNNLLYVVIGAAVILGAEVLQTVIEGTVDNITP